VIPADQEMLIGGELAQYFEWSYIENLNCIRGVQQKHIAVREPMDCKIVVKTKESESLANDANIGFITNIQPAPKMNNTNKTDDDAVSNYKKVATVENLIIAENEKN